LASSDLTLPREVQSDLHDLADEMGEQIARGTFLKVTVEKPIPEGNYEELVCTCLRFSQRISDTEVKYWYEDDPDCKYIHLAKPTGSFTVPV
jgi:hypothetical protein